MNLTYLKNIIKYKRTTIRFLILLATCSNIIHSSDIDLKDNFKNLNGNATHTYQILSIQSSIEEQQIIKSKNILKELTNNLNSNHLLMNIEKSVVMTTCDIVDDITYDMVKDCFKSQVYDLILISSSLPERLMKRLKQDTVIQKVLFYEIINIDNHKYELIKHRFNINLDNPKSLPLVRVIKIILNI